MFSNLRVEIINNGKDRIVLDDYIYKNDRYKITVKKGYKTDGASIPKIFWSVLSSPFDGALVYGAIIHDGLYAKMTLTRKECDKLLKEMAIEKGYSTIKANIIYSLVRLFGKTHWQKDTANQMSLVDIKIKK